MDMIKFHPYFSWKDMGPFIALLILILMISSLNPLILGDPENFNMANPLVTPIHIQPEWYFLFAYAILRAIPNKLGGVVALLLRIFILAILPLSLAKKNSPKFSISKKIKFFSIAASFSILTWLGANPVEPPYERISFFTGAAYFLSFLIFCPFFNLSWK